jgi:hypothetical protein
MPAPRALTFAGISCNLAGIVMQLYVYRNLTLVTYRSSILMIRKPLFGPDSRPQGNFLMLNRRWAGIFVPDSRVGYEDSKAGDLVAEPMAKDSHDEIFKNFGKTCNVSPPGATI